MLCPSDFIKMYWKILFVMTFPLVCLPIFILNNTQAYRCMYVFVLMCMFWITEALPPPVTSLLPMVLFPIMGVLGSDKVAANYMNDTNMMLIGSILIAIAMENTKLHIRIALHVIRIIGCSIRKLHIGLGFVTMFISMWIANTAATALMLPIVIGILEALQTQGVIKMWKPPDPDKMPDEAEELRPTNITMCYFISIAYCSLIGGTGCLIGSGSHLAFKGIYETRFPDSPGINFAKWMMFNIPLMLVSNILIIIWLQLLYLGLGRPNSKAAQDLKATVEASDITKGVILSQISELGPTKFSEYCVGLCFILAILLWFFRRPGFMPGWPVYLSTVKIGDAVVAVFVMFLFFLIPKEPTFIYFRSPDESKRPTGPSPSIATWKLLQQKMHWGLLFVLGGGFAMADGAKASGMTKLIADYLKEFLGEDIIVVFLIVCVTASLITQFLSSNVACVTILTPIILDISVVAGYHPLYLGLANALACCYSFFLPVSTPPNALISGPSHMRGSDMMKSGIGTFIICLGLLLLVYPFYAPLVWEDIHTFPEWAHDEPAKATPKS